MRSVFRLGLCGRSDVLFGDDEQVRGGLRIDVGKTDAIFVFVEAICWNIARRRSCRRDIRKMRYCSA